MIEYQVCINLQSESVSRLDQVEQFGFGTEPRRHAAFLIEFTQIVLIVGIVAHRFPPRRLVRGWKPQRGEASLRNRGQFGFDVSPPLVLAIFYLRTIPIKRLQHDTHKLAVLPSERVSPRYTPDND